MASSINMPSGPIKITPVTDKRGKPVPATTKSKPMISADGSVGRWEV